jgi:hypothetical protein
MVNTGGFTMRKFAIFLAFLMALPFAANVASAGSYFTVPGFKRILVKANRTTRVAYHVQSNSTCHRHYRTSVIITHQPAHGILKVRKTKMRVPYNHPDRRCRGKILHVTKVYYRPDAGYRGRDAFGYQLTGLSTDARTGARHFGVRVK